jgi:hypothetical protein
MRRSSLHSTRWPTPLRRRGHVPAAARQAEAPATAGTKPTRQRIVGTSTAATARDCRRSDAIAAVMQVRPLSVVSGTAGSGPFGHSSFRRLGWS